MRIFLAGVTGVIGVPLTPLLLAAGHVVTGSTRSAEKAAGLKTIGVEAIVVDVFDAAALRDAVVGARPEVVIHQLTDLPARFDPAQLAATCSRATPRSASKARQSGRGGARRRRRRFIAQSVAFAYADGPEPHAESDPLASRQRRASRRVTVRGRPRAGRRGPQDARHRRHRAALRPALRSRAPGATAAGRSRHCTSMRPPMLRCLPSPTAARASTISPTTTARFRSRRPARN